MAGRPKETFQNGRPIEKSVQVLEDYNFHISFSN